MKCPYCGKTVPDGAKFCGACGKKMKSLKSQKSEKEKKSDGISKENTKERTVKTASGSCRICGAPLEGNSMFCSHCGMRQNAVPASVTVPEKKFPQPAARLSENSKLPFIVAAVLVVLGVLIGNLFIMVILFVLAAAVLLLMRRGKGTDDSGYEGSASSECAQQGKEAISDTCNFCDSGWKSLPEQPDIARRLNGQLSDILEELWNASQLQGELNDLADRLRKEEVR